ncbi:MAG: ComF family protein [Gammaproteobacteria bacterium]|nr:ComF family protein [Gammaproteobacteria bacterium]
MINNWSIFNHTPSNCFLCGQGVRLEQLFCQNCSDTLPYLHNSCLRCANPLSGTGGLICGKCQLKSPPIDRTISVFHYENPISHVIQQYKFRERIFLARWLAGYLIERVKSEYERLPDLIMPVPLHPKRLGQRGFNQALELTKVISKQISIKHTPQLCQRTKNTAPQVELPGSERHKNLRGVFQTSKPLNGEHIALIDDVMTTGSTLNEIAKTLKKAGASRVDAWVIARTSK